MANVFGTLVNAVNNATSPEARNAAANALSTAIADAANRGEDVRKMFESALGGAAAAIIGPTQLAAIGNVQRFLADVASGAVVPTPQSASVIIAQLVAVLGGMNTGVPGMPGLPGLPQWPGLPFPMPQIPGLDPCKFFKCLAASIDCSGAPGGRGIPGKDGNETIDNMIGGGIEILKRARDLTEEKLRQTAQALKDLSVAANAAKGVVKTQIEAAQKEAEAQANDLRAKSEQLGQAIGGAIAQVWPMR